MMTRFNDPKTADALLDSAVSILTQEQKPFDILPWSEVMTKANAEVKAKEMKAATKKAATKGVTKPRHVPKTAEQIADDHGMEQTDATPVVVQVDEQPAPGVQSGLSDGGAPNLTGFSIFNPVTQEKSMTEAKPTKEEKAAQAEAKKELLNKLAAERAEKKAKLAEEKAAAKLAREQAAAERQAAREARAEQLKASGRTYVGSMTALTDRVKSGVYVKSLTGQLRSTDELATALDAVPPTNVIKLAMTALGLDANPYERLNVGQQSMNLRNKLRGAIKAGKVTIEQIKEIRDANGYAAAEDEVAKRAEKKAAREAAKAAKAEKAKAAEAAKLAKAVTKLSKAEVAAQAVA